MAKSLCRHAAACYAKKIVHECYGKNGKVLSHQLTILISIHVWKVIINRYIQINRQIICFVMNWAYYRIILSVINWHTIGSKNLVMKLWQFLWQWYSFFEIIVSWLGIVVVPLNCRFLNRIKWLSELIKWTQLQSMI